MKVHFVSGIAGDKVEITNKDGEKEIYAYGYNASHSRSFSTPEKPYIGDIIRQYASEENVKLADIPVTGFYVLSQREAPDGDVNWFRERYMKED